MKKALITVTISREVELDPELYYEGITDEEMLKEELKYAEDLFYEWVDTGHVHWLTEAKMINEEGNSINE